MKWSESAWVAATPIYNKILEHPFLTSLMDGTLARDKFIFYIQQDALYLAEFGRALAGIAAKLDSLDESEAFLGFAKDTMEVERVLHQSFFGPAKQLEHLEPAPGCLLYTAYVNRQLAGPSLEDAMAGILPCFWVYKEVGDYILAHQDKSINNQYQDWIDTYGGEAYSAAVMKCIDICDAHAALVGAAQRENMTKIFVNCTRMEWMFWDSAWRLESWPV